MLSYSRTRTLTRMLWSRYISRHGQQPEAKRKRGRPVEREMPDPIPADPEEVMRALVGTAPKGGR